MHTLYPLKKEMKRLFIFALCLLSQQLTKAGGLPADSTGKAKMTGSANGGPGDTTMSLVVKELFSPGAAFATNATGFEGKLNAIRKDVQLDYNDFVQDYINVYTRHKDEMSQVLTLTKYYFPIFEKIFREAGIPEEIKYLSIVESKLNPFAVSRVGATGPWQFMPATAKTYGLGMDSYVDERRDPVRACYAAAAYLKDAYMEFGDWLLAIASYNCGKSNVERAVEKAGALDFWSIRQYLPAETRGYVPAYIAIAYVMNYADEHDIFAREMDMPEKIDTVLIDKYISLSNVAKALGMETAKLAQLNPSYKKQVVNGTAANPRRLIIPQASGVNYDVLYTALNDPNANIAMQPKAVYIKSQPKPVMLAVARPVATTISNATTITTSSTTEPEIHIVKRGENLVDVASIYGVDIDELKKWNHLRNYTLTPGQKIKLTANAVVAVVDKRAEFIFYKVKAGDTLSAIADKFEGTTVESIKALNGLKRGSLQPGMKLKIDRG